MSENGSIYHNEELLDDLRAVKIDMAKARSQKKKGLFTSLRKRYDKLMEAKLIARAKRGFDDDSDLSGAGGFGDSGGCDCAGCSGDD